MILSPTGKPSKQAEGYAHLLIAEILTGVTQGFEGNMWTDRGTELEPEARAYYEFVTGSEVQQVGFCTTYDGLCGCSPDGLVDDGLLEIKCPSPQVHVEYLLGAKVPTKYLSQIQGQMFVCEREWCDFLAYFPGMDPVLQRVPTDKAWHAAFRVELDKFHEMCAGKLAKLRGLT
jgi:hypothetical protein